MRDRRDAKQIALEGLRIDTDKVPNVMVNRVSSERVAGLLRDSQCGRDTAHVFEQDLESGTFSGVVLPGLQPEVLQDNLRSDLTDDEATKVERVRSALGRKVAALSDAEIITVLESSAALSFSDARKQSAAFRIVFLKNGGTIIPSFSGLQSHQLEVHGVATGNHASVTALFYLDPAKSFEPQIVLVEAGPHYGKREGRGLFPGGYSSLDQFEDAIANLSRELAEEVVDDTGACLIDFDAERLTAQMPQILVSAGDAHTSPVTILTPFAYNISPQDFSRLENHKIRIDNDFVYAERVLAATKGEARGLKILSLSDALATRAEDLLVYPEGKKILQGLSKFLYIS